MGGRRFSSGKFFHSRPKQDSTEYLPEASSTEECVTEMEAYGNDNKKPLDNSCSQLRLLEGEHAVEGVRIDKAKPIG